MKKMNNFQNISLLLKTGKVYEVETFFIEKFKKFPFESLYKYKWNRKEINEKKLQKKKFSLEISSAVSF